MNKSLKLFIDYGPALAFLGIYILEWNIFSFLEQAPLYQATGAMIILSLLTLPASYIAHDGHIPTKHLAFTLMIFIFGGMTLYFNDESFLKIKPTIIYLALAALLLIGLKFKKIFLKSLFEEILNLDDAGWQGFTIRFGIFFLLLAGLNEIVWRFFSTDIWVTFKFFGALPLMFLFIVLQMSFFEKHLIKSDEK